jgi:putative two-component system response regulator
VESHHERWDGKGYPHGLAGDAIPLTARVLCLADVYDALTSERSYKAACTHDEAIAIMRGDVGSQFDPALFPIFEEVAHAMMNVGTVQAVHLVHDVRLTLVA